MDFKQVQSQPIIKNAETANRRFQVAAWTSSKSKASPSSKMLKPPTGGFRWRHGLQASPKPTIIEKAETANRRFQLISGALERPRAFQSPNAGRLPRAAFFIFRRFANPRAEGNVPARIKQRLLAPAPSRFTHI
ncbi:hypothetical protein [Stappia sp.]|uniref:hypothetical protein n=1 Tax=Stappia sp. TaxID=1870903 RepID=UPI003C7DF94E